MIKKTGFLVLTLVLGPLAATCGAWSDSVAPDEDLLLFTTSGNLDAAGHFWQIPVHGWIFEREKGSWWRAALQKGLLEMLELDPADRQSKFLKQRLEMFLVDNERGKKLTVVLNGRPYPVGPSGANGHFEGRVEVPVQDLQSIDKSGVPTVSAAITAADGRRFESRFQLPAVHGLSVVSDIDDTIKVSRVLDKEELLANTFLREYEALPGMASVYRHWAAQGAAFHYVSASPWQLYPELSRFICKAAFPPGEIQLRYLRIKDSSFFAFMRASREFKIKTIEAIIKRFPKRKFILVGDSGEKDPAIYAAVARAYPGNVVKIFIHLILTDPDHRRKVANCFKDLPRHSWALYHSGSQLSEMAQLPALRYSPLRQPADSSLLREGRKR